MPVPILVLIALTMSVLSIPKVVTANAKKLKKKINNTNAKINKEKH